MDAVNTTPFVPAWFVTKFDPRAFSIVVLVKGTFRLVHGKAMEPAAEQQPPTGDVYVEDNPKRPLIYGFDFAPWKPRADIVLSAVAWAPGGVPAGQVDAGFRLGHVAKTLRVSGDRYWLGRSEASQPKPFSSSPITWERAFGGESYAWNPLGRGIAEVLLGEDVRAYPLPNVEVPANPQRKRGDKLPPAGFGPISATWPQRADKAGKCDKNYLKERWPYYPESFDWAHFNLAPEDQQIEGYLKGDEEVVFRNLHPKLAELRTRLPGLRIRAFLNERLKARQQLREVQLRLDTFWADPGAELGVLVWRGQAQVRSEKLLEVTNLLVASERMEMPPLPLPAYEPILLRAALTAAGDEELEPIEPELDFEDEVEELAAETESESPALPPPAEDGTPGETTAEPDADESEPDPEDPLTLPQVRRMVAERLSFQGRDLSGLDLRGLNFRELDLSEAILEGAVLEGADLSGANLAGALLAHANLSRAQCVGTRFTECDLTRAWLDGANLEGANLSGADCTGASFRRAALRQANATEAVFCEADLSDAVLEQASLTAADLCDTRLHRANLRAADLSEAALEHAWGRDVSAERAKFPKLRAASCRLPGANFSGGAGEESVWEMSDLAGADFSGAELQRAEFSTAYLAEATFEAADLREARLVEARLPRARLRRTNLFGAAMDKADLSGANIGESNLYEATLMDADVRGANFELANLRRVRMRKE